MAWLRLESTFCEDGGFTCFEGGVGDSEDEFVAGFGGGCGHY